MIVAVAVLPRPAGERQEPVDTWVVHERQQTHERRARPVQSCFSFTLVT